MLNETILKSKFFHPSDYSYLINIDFSFSMLPLVCEEDEPLLIILVHTSVNNFGKRKVIRETWGQSENNIKILFFIGMVEGYDIQNKLEDESRQYQDLVQGSFIDSYHNLTYKHVMALKYVVYHCAKAEFILKVDDDVFVNIPNLKKFIETYNCQHGMLNKIFCSRLHSPPVLRKGKWKASLVDYPENNYPTHCSGFAILYPQDVLYLLYSKAQRTKFFWIDDVLVTGILAKNSNISHIGLENLVLSRKDIHNIVDLSFTNINKPFLFGDINLNEHQIRSLWAFVINHTSEASILDYLNY
ncbi:hypothetical protein NQ314_010001 [Rhamnusium bicolor]|uniref:Hexosyltransferase n=1 Tax=Rhamnusium bicolor TaxID=1586634 RepID=A0AAV8XVF9_9CUCU|nr:hypothetical protein NQ314_010001 [Rhamnusium bicolor]